MAALLKELALSRGLIFMALIVFIPRIHATLDSAFQMKTKKKIINRISS